MSTKERAIRVCHVSVSLKTGGLERILAGMAKWTDREHFPMDFVALREEGRFAEEIRRLGGSVTTLKCRNRWEMVRQLRDLFRAGNYDIVHTHNTYPHLYGTIAARWGRIPIVVNTRHGQRSGHGWKSRFLFRLASRWVDRIVAVSDDAASLCIASDRIAANKVTRIWNGIDVNDFTFRGPSQNWTAITVGRLVPEKDLVTLIKAMSIAIVVCPKLRLKIVGDGPSRPALEALTKELCLEQQIEFVGEQQDIPSLLSECGFYVSSTLTEGISLTLLEAMAVGLPVIATRVGGNPEIVCEQETGYLVEPANPLRLAQAMVTVCSEQGRWAAMGLAGRGRVKDFFSVEQMVENYQKLYRELAREASS